MQILQNYPVFVARQPIFDRLDSVWAYELLYRNREFPNSAGAINDPDQATLEVISHGFSLAVTASPKKKPLFINFPENLILEKSAFALPSDLCVVEILETVNPTQDIIDACHELKNNGYRIALDDYFGQPGFEEIIRIADFIKVDILKLSPLEIRNLVKDLSKNNAKILAEKIEHYTIYKLCKKIGFDFFQGFFFCVPQVITGSKPSSAQVSRLNMIKDLCVDNVDLSDLSGIIKKDASLSYRLLNFINSAFFGFRKEISSIHQAVTLLGIRQTKQWLRVNILSDMNETPMDSELTFMAALRGKFLEIASEIHTQPPFPPESMFLLGLFSLLDALIGRPMDEILEKLPIEEKMKNILINPNQSPHGLWLGLIKAQEKGQWNKVIPIINKLQLDPLETSNAYNASVEWVKTSLAPTQKHI